MSALVLVYRQPKTARPRAEDEARLLKAFRACDPHRRESLLDFSTVLARASKRGDLYPPVLFDTHDQEDA